ncbi:MAG: carboxypeptidase-like regulatory domain-containing protein [Vulcanisaeta sp.]
MRVIYLALIGLLFIIAITYLGHMIRWQSLSIMNPLNEKLSVDVQGVTNLFIEALELNAVSNYTDALSLLKALGASGAVRAMPALSQLHSYESQLTNYLSELGSIYSESLSLISMGNYSGARSLALEGLLLDSEANNELNTIANIISSVAPNSTGQVIGTIQSIRQYLVNLNNTFLGIIASNYTGTELTIAVSPNPVVIGEDVITQGVLTMVNGTPIPNATVTIYIGNNQVGYAITNAAGHYSLSFIIPQIYMNITNVTALYNPTPGSNFLPSRAVAPIIINFNSTQLIVNYTKQVTWGSTINISGYVNGPPLRQVIISINGFNVSTYAINNRFYASVGTTNMTPGNYSLMVYAPPINSYSPAYFNGTIAVSPIIINATVTASNVAIAGLSVPVTIHVTPWINNLTLTIYLGNEAMNVSAPGPNFTVSLSIPASLSMGRRYIVVSVVTNPPVMGTPYAYGIFVINPIEVVIPIALAILLFLLVRSGMITITSRQEVINPRESESLNPIPLSIRARPEVKALERKIMSNVPVGKINIDSVKEIVSAMASAIYVVSKKTGVKLRSTDTLREYLSAMAGKLGDDDYTVLASLVKLTEYALYSPYAPTDNDVNTAWDLARRFTQ